MGFVYNLFYSFQHGLAINLVDGPKSMSVLKEIERHFGKDIAKLDAEVLLLVLLTSRLGLH